MIGSPIWAKIRYVGLIPYFMGHRVYNEGGDSLVLMRLADDPLFRRSEGFPIPLRSLLQLKRIRQAGIKCDRSEIGE